MPFRRVTLISQNAAAGLNPGVKNKRSPFFDKTVRKTDFTFSESSVESGLSFLRFAGAQLEMQKTFLRFGPGRVYIDFQNAQEI